VVHGDTLGASGSNECVVHAKAHVYGGREVVRTKDGRDRNSKDISQTSKFHALAVWKLLMVISEVKRH
jgi:hypothetical protein